MQKINCRCCGKKSEVQADKTERFAPCPKCSMMYPIIREQLSLNTKKNLKDKLNKKEVKKMADKKETKKGKILELLAEGKSVDEIVTETGFRKALVQFYSRQK